MSKLSKAEKEKLTTWKQYTCGYCGKIFQQGVRKVLGNVEAGFKRPKHNVSSQVQCPRCKNFLKTWDEGVEDLE